MTIPWGAERNKFVKERKGEYKPDPNCKYCDGKGLIWTMVAGEPEEDACDCVEWKEND